MPPHSLRAFEETTTPEAEEKRACLQLGDNTIHNVAAMSQQAGNRPAVQVCSVVVYFHIQLSNAYVFGNRVPTEWYEFLHSLAAPASKRRLLNCNVEDVCTHISPPASHTTKFRGSCQYHLRLGKAYLAVSHSPQARQCRSRPTRKADSKGHK